jgi:EpsI family protein
MKLCPWYGGGVWAKTSIFISAWNVERERNDARRVNPPAASQHPSRPQAVAAALCALAGLAVFQFFGNGTRGYIDTASLFSWWGRQWFDPAAESEQGPLVVLIAGWMFWRNLGKAGGRGQGAGGRSQESGGRGQESVGKRRADDAGGEALGWAGAAMVGGLALHVLGYAAQQARLSIAAFLLFLGGVAILAGGRRWGRAAAFPLCFMLLAVPMNFLDTGGFYLRLWVTAASTRIAHLVGVGVVANGTQLFAPDGRYQYDVAAACSGVRSLMALVALSLLVGWLNFRGAGRRAVLVLLCFPLAYIGNVARIVTVVLAGQWFGQRAGERVHDAAGLLVFVVVLGGVLGAASIWRRFAPEREPASFGRGVHATGTGAGGRPGPLRAVATIVLIAAALTGWFTTRVDAWAVERATGIKLAADGVNPAVLPSVLAGGWVGRDVEVTKVERDTLPADTGYARKLYFSTADPARPVFFSIVLSGRDRTSIHRPEICLVGQGWTIESSFARDFALTGAMADRRVPANVLRISQAKQGKDGAGQRVPALFAYWFVGGDAVVATSGERLWRTATDRLLHFRADRWAYIVAQTIADDGEAAALARLQAVVGAAAPEFQTAWK